jgi:hypothetical protein
MHRRAARALFALACAFTLALPVAALAQDASLSATLTYVGPGPGSTSIYRYDYSLTNNAVTPSIIELFVFFDTDGVSFSGDNADFNNTIGFSGSTTSAPGWDPTVIEDADPNPWMVDFFNSGLDNTIEPGETLSGFSVTFLWKGAGLPGAQFFEAINGFAHEGTSVLAGVNFPPITGSVTSGCSGEPLYGVPVALLSLGNIVAQTYTAMDGSFTFSNLAPGSYTVTIATPLGYFNHDPISVTVGQSADFVLECKPSDPVCDGSDSHNYYDDHDDHWCAPRTQSFWAWEVLAATFNYKIRIPKLTLLAYLDQIYNHFATNPVHAIPLYNVAPTASATTKLTQAKLILWEQVGVSGYDRDARAKLLALMFNVVDGRLNPADVASVDGRTVSQAITFSWDLITNAANVPPGVQLPGWGWGWYYWHTPNRDELAAYITAKLSNEDQIPAGIIPASVPNIAYNQPETGVKPVAVRTVLMPAMPNPMGAAGTDIRFSLAKAGEVRLEVFDTQGRLVNTLFEGFADAGETSIHWTGSNVASGVYFTRLSSAEGTFTQKLIRAE